jgi:hypothetical protein
MKRRTDRIVVRRTPTAGRASTRAAIGVAVATAVLVACAAVSCTAPGTSQTPVPPTSTPSPVASGRPTPIPTTVTDWGAILDAMPQDMPRHPAAQDAPPDGPATATLTSSVDVATLVAWYDDAMPASRFEKTSSSAPDESGAVVTEYDGSRRAPGCRAQVTVKPQGGETLIVILVGAACQPSGN